jgi:DNA-binding NarL/FixJ family response regulator
MTKPNIQINNDVREMTDEEYETYLFLTNAHAEEEVKVQAKIEARQSALAKLAALGLTEEEIAAL